MLTAKFERILNKQQSSRQVVGISTWKNSSLFYNRSIQVRQKANLINEAEPM
jgi:hypothetical protein